MKKALSLLLVVSLMFSLMVFSVGTVSAAGEDYSTFYTFDSSLEGFPGTGSYADAAITMSQETEFPLSGLGSLKVAVDDTLDTTTYGKGSNYMMLPDGTGYDGIVFKVKSNLPANSDLMFWMRQTNADTTYQDIYMGTMNTIMTKEGVKLNTDDVLWDCYNDAGEVIDQVTDTSSFRPDWMHIVMPEGAFDGYIFLPFEPAVGYGPAYETHYAQTTPYEKTNLMLKFDIVRSNTDDHPYWDFPGWLDTTTLFDDFSYYNGTDYASIVAQMNKSYLCTVDVVTTPEDAILGADTITANVPFATSSITVDVTPSENANWALYSDAECTSEIANKVMPLSIGANSTYVKVTAEDGLTTSIYTLTVTRVIDNASTDCDVISSTIPADATIGDTTITATLEGIVESITIDVTVSADATWKLYSNLGCTSEITSKVMPIALGLNTKYLKVTAQDATTTKVYTVRVTKIASAECDVVSSTIPYAATIGATTITANTNASSLTINVTPSSYATWALYSDAECTTEIADKVMALSVGANIAYILVDAQNGVDSKVYTLTITRVAPGVATLFDFEDGTQGYPGTLPAGMTMTQETTAPLSGSGSLNMTITSIPDDYTTVPGSNYLYINNAAEYDGIMIRLKSNVPAGCHAPFWMSALPSSQSAYIGKINTYTDLDGNVVASNLFDNAWGHLLLPTGAFDGYLFLPFSGLTSYTDAFGDSDSYMFQWGVFQYAAWAYGDLNGSETLMDNISLYKGTEYTTLIDLVDATAPCSVDGLTINHDNTNILSGIAPNTDLTEFEALISLDVSATTVAIDINETVIGATDLVGTGSVVSVYNTDTSLYKTYTLVVKGDIDGTGAVDIADLVAIKSHLLNITPLTGVALTAGKITNQSGIAISDLLAVKKHSLGITLIT